MKPKKTYQTCPACGWMNKYDETKVINRSGGRVTIACSNCGHVLYFTEDKK